MSETTGGGRTHTRVKVKRESDEATKAELRRWKNREAARRVRERKSNQLNTYKAQVDDLKKENQKLLQIIAQLQSTALSPASAATTTVTADGSTPAGQFAAVATAGCTATPSMSGAPDSIDSNPSAAAAAAAAAVAAAAAEQIASGNLTESQLLHPVISQHGSLPERTESEAVCERVMSQPGIAASAAVMGSSSLIPLPGAMSAPLPEGMKEHGRPQLAPDEVPLLRACGCTGEEECEECEGIRVTILGSSSMPLVTTPGPKPKPLTLEDLCIPGISASHPDAGVGRAASSTGFAHHHKDQLHVLGTVYSHPQLALRQQRLTGSSSQSQQQQQRQQSHKKGQAHEQLAGMDLDLVETLELTRAPHSDRGSKLDSNSSSSNAVHAAKAAHDGAVRRMGGSCYVRKSSMKGHSNAAAIDEHPPSPEGVQQGRQKLRRHEAGMDTASAAAALASDPGLAVELIEGEDDADVSGSIDRLLAAKGVGGGAGAAGESSYAARELPQQQQQPRYGQQQLDVSGTGRLEAVGDATAAATAAATGASSPMAVDSAAAAAAAPLYQQADDMSGRAAGGQQQQQKHKKGHKLFRSLAAAVNGLIRPGSSSAGGNGSVSNGRMYNTLLAASSVPISAAGVAGSCGDYVHVSAQSARLGAAAGFVANDSGTTDMQVMLMQQQQHGNAGVVQRKGSFVGESTCGSEGTATAAAHQQQQQQQAHIAAAAAAAVNACVPSTQGMPSMHEQIQQLKLQIQAQQAHHAAQQAAVEEQLRLRQQQQQQQSTPEFASSAPLPAGRVAGRSMFDGMSGEVGHVMASLSTSGCYAAAPGMANIGGTCPGQGSLGATLDNTLGRSSSSSGLAQQQQQQVLSGSNALSGGGNAVFSNDGQQQQVLSGSNISGTGYAVCSSNQQQQVVLSGANLSSSGTLFNTAGAAAASFSGSMLPLQSSNAAAAAAMSGILCSAPAVPFSGATQMPPAAAAGRYSWPGSAATQQQQQQFLLQQQQQALWSLMPLSGGAGEAGKGLRGFSIIEGAAEGSDEDAVMQLALQEGVLLQ